MEEPSGGRGKCWESGRRDKEGPRVGRVCRGQRDLLQVERGSRGNQGEGSNGMRVPGSDDGGLGPHAETGLEGVGNGNGLFGERKSGYGNPAERSTRESEDGEGGHQKIPISNRDGRLLGLSDRGSGHLGGSLGERGAGSDCGEEGCDHGEHDSGQTVSHLGERVTEKHIENLLGLSGSQLKQEQHPESEYPQDLSLDCSHPEFWGHNAHGASEVQAPVRFQFCGPKGKKTRSHRAKQTRCNPEKDLNSPTERRLRGPKKGKIRPQREMLSCGPVVERSGGHKAEARMCSREEQCEGSTRDVEVFTGDFSSRRCLKAKAHGEESLTDKGDCTLLVSQLGERFGTAYCGFQTTLYRNPVYNYCHMHVGDTGLDFGDAMPRNPVCTCERGDVTVMGCHCDSGVVSASRPVFEFKDEDIACDVGSWTVGYSGCELEDVVLECKFGPPVKDAVLKDFGFDSRTVSFSPSCHCEDVAVGCPGCRNRATDIATSGHRCRENACWGSGCDIDIIGGPGFDSGVMGVKKLECYVGAESPVSKNKDACVESAECDAFEVCVSSCGYHSGDEANCGPVKELAALGGVNCHHKKASYKDRECQHESLLHTFLSHKHRDGCGEKFDHVSERSLGIEYRDACGGNLEDQQGGGWSMAVGDENVSASYTGSEYKDYFDGSYRDKCRVNCRRTAGEPRNMSECGSGSQYKVGELDYQDPCGRSPVVGCSDACHGSPGGEYNDACAKTLVDEYQDFCVKTSEGVYGEVAAKVSEDESLQTELRDPRCETCTVIYQYSTFEYVENVIVHPELEHNSVSASGFAFGEACDKSLGCKETGCPGVPFSGMKTNSGAPGSPVGEDARWICSIGECRNAEFTVPSCMYRDAEYLDTSWDYEDMGDESGDAWWLCPSGGYDNSWWTCPKGLYIDPGCWCPRNDFESSECWCPGDVEGVSPGEVDCWLSAEEYRYTGDGGDPCTLMSRGHPRGFQGCGVSRTTEETDIGLLKVAASERILTLDYAATGECNTGWWEEGLGDSPFDTHSGDGDTSAQNEVESSCTVGLCSDLTDLELVTTVGVCSETPPVALEVEARSRPPSGSDGEGTLQELGTATSENLEPLVGCGRLLATEVVWLEREEEQGQSRLQILGGFSVDPPKPEDIWLPRKWPKAVLGCSQISANPKGKQQSKQVADVWVPREKNSRKVWHDWAQRKKGDEVPASVFSDKSLAGTREVQLQKEKDAVHTWDMWVRRSRARKCALAVGCERDGGVDSLGGQAPLKDRHRGQDSLGLKGGS